MEADIKTSMAKMAALLAGLDRIKANVEKAIRQAETDMMLLFGSEPAAPQSPTKARKASTLNGGNVSPTNGASAGPASAP